MNGWMDWMDTQFGMQVRTKKFKYIILYSLSYVSYCRLTDSSSHHQLCMHTTCVSNVAGGRPGHGLRSWRHGFWGE